MPAKTISSSPTVTSAVANGVQACGRDLPDGIAVRDQQRTLTFAEFDALVGAAAERLADEAPEPWLPVFVDRTVASAVAVHAAIRAGRAFAPIESRLPPDRVIELLARLGTPGHALLASPEMARLLPDGVRAVTSNGSSNGSTGRGLAPQPVDLTRPGALVFTSGSTGRPKGVVRSWGALAEKLSLEAPPAPGAPLRTIAQAHPFSFSAGLGQLTRIAVGDSLRMVDGTTISPEALIQWVTDNEVTTLTIGGSLTRSILRAADGRRLLPGVTTVGIGAEPMTWDIVPPLRSLLSPDATIMVRFSATEVGEVMRYPIRPDDPIGEGPIPIGVAATSPRVRLEPVDGSEGPDTPGALQQMLIRDPVAMYYLGDPELTAEQFFTDADGTRWWRSGDTVSIDGEGRYVHRGRVDDMVKINGMRIEPREAEAALAAIPGIGAACVLVQRTPTGKRRLIAHVRVDDDTLTPTAVREQLTQRLPSHLVPALLIRHDELPGTDRGKIDRAALLATPLEPWRVGARHHAVFELELWIAAQVTSILDLAEVHTDDDIWNAGMDSLGAVELCAAFADAGLGQIDPTVLMRERTPRAIERYLVGSRPENPSAVVVLNHEGTATPIFAIPGGGGTSFAFNSLAQHLGGQQPLAVIEPRGMHNRGRVDRTITARTDHAIAEISARLNVGDPCVVLGYSAGATIAFEICRRLSAAGHVAHLVLLDAAPRGRGEIESDHIPLSAVLDDGRRAAIDVSGRLRTRGPLEHVRRLPRYWHQYRKLRRMQRLVRNPGPPGYSMERYSAFQRIQRVATSKYDLQPAPIDATLIHIVGREDIADACRPWVRSLDVHVVGGDHHSMLHPPHVSVMADVVAGVIDRVLGPSIGAKLPG